MSRGKLVLAYSGGLDTSYCVMTLKNQGWDVYAVTVDTGGFTPAELAEARSRAETLGAKYRCIDACLEVYRDFVTYIVKGNVLRGGVYPLCVAAERVQQAIVCANVAKEIGATAVAHGSTGAGNDQVRFDAVVRTMLPEIEIVAPIREGRISRIESTEALRAAGIAIDDKTRDFSINASLWGTTIGGKETHDPWTTPGEEVWHMTRTKEGIEATEIIIQFEKGCPVAIDGEALDGVSLIRKLNTLAGERGIGRGIHMGDTIIGIKGRIAFEAPAPIVLIDAHRELEKLVLTKWQAFWKQNLSTFYGSLLHEGLYFDPVMRDIEAFLDQSQRCVSGDVRVELGLGHAAVRGVRSPHSLMALDVARYGEDNAYWNGQDARGFCKLFPLQAAMANWRDQKNS
jgi:argininosuccinate synthase